MKRLNAVISAVVFLFFTGCSSYPHQSWLEDRSFDKIADDRASEIVTALENGDQAAIRSMFSNQAWNEAEELDDAILSAINIIKVIWYHLMERLQPMKVRMEKRKHLKSGQIIRY